MTDTSSKSAIQQAIDDVGSQTALANKIGVSQGLVWQWVNGAAIPTHHFSAITNVSTVTAEQLLADEMAKAARRKAAASQKAKKSAA